MRPPLIATDIANKSSVNAIAAKYESNQKIRFIVIIEIIILVVVLNHHYFISSKFNNEIIIH